MEDNLIHQRKHKNSKISDDLIAAIRVFCLTNTKTEATKKFGVSASIVWNSTTDITTRRVVSQEIIEGENWKGVVEYEKYYKISDLGRIKSLHSGRVMGTGVANWYPTVVLCKNGTRKSVCVHQLVAKAFIPNPENKPCVNHIDGNKRNNHISNLEWATFKENENHSYKKLGKVATMNNLHNFSKEWLKNPLSIGNVTFRGKRQKDLYKMMKNGVAGSVLLRKGYNRHSIRDFILKLGIGGMSVIKYPDIRNSRTPVKRTHYKIDI